MIVEGCRDILLHPRPYQRASQLMADWVRSNLKHKVYGTTVLTCSCPGLRPRLEVCSADYANIPRSHYQRTSKLLTSFCWLEWHRHTTDTARRPMLGTRNAILGHCYRVVHSCRTGATQRPPGRADVTIGWPSGARRGIYARCFDSFQRKKNYLALQIWKHGQSLSSNSATATNCPQAPCSEYQNLFQPQRRLFPGNPD